MRELKFRGWASRGFVYFDLREDNDFGFHDFYSCCESNTIEQYTGLKDKNGKEIYEGDIVQIDDHILGDFEVLWHNLGWKIKRSVGFETLSVHKPNDIVVIGNIHENLDLLEEEE